MSSRERDLLQKAIKAQNKNRSKKKNNRASRSSSNIKSSFDVNGILQRLVDYQKQTNLEPKNEPQSKTNDSLGQEVSQAQKFGYLYQHNLKKNNKKKKSKIVNQSKHKNKSKRKQKSRKTKSKGHSKTNRSLVNKDEIPDFSQNYTDLRIGETIDTEHAKINVEKISPSITKTNKLKYLEQNHAEADDNSARKNKLKAIKNKEDKEVKKMNNSKLIYKSSILSKYYIPIYKRVDTELEKRKARLQKLTAEVLQEREIKDKFLSDQLFFPRTQLSYEVQNKHYYGTDKSIEIDEDVNKDLEDIKDKKHRLSNKQMFANFMHDHQAWEMRKKRKIDKKLEEKESKIRSELTFTPRINEHSQHLASKRHGRVESRLLSVGNRTNEKIKQIQKSQILSFKPMIYDTQKKSRCQSVCSGMMSHSSIPKNNDLSSLPPRPDIACIKPKVQFKEHERMLYYEIQHEKNKLKNYSPVIANRTDSSFNTHQVDSF